MRKLSLPELVTMIAVSAATFAIGFHLYEAHKRLDVTTIQSPVLLTKEKYKVGEFVIGRFEGELVPNGPFTITRRLDCATQRLSLVDISSSTSERRILDGKKDTPIFRLNAADTASGFDIRPDTDCVVSFVNTYTRNLPLGGERVFEVRYFTEPFDIIEP